MRRKKSVEKYMKEGIFEENAIALCHNVKHYGYLTDHMIKEHQCLQKHCPLMEKLPDKHFWYCRKIRQELRKLVKTGGSYICVNGRLFDKNSLDISALARYCKNEYRENGAEPEIKALI